MRTAGTGNRLALALMTSAMLIGVGASCSSSNNTTTGAPSTAAPTTATTKSATTDRPSPSSTARTNPRSGDAGTTGEDGEAGGQTSGGDSSSGGGGGATAAGPFTAEEVAAQWDKVAADKGVAPTVAACVHDELLKLPGTVSNAEAQAAAEQAVQACVAASPGNVPAGTIYLPSGR